MKRFLIAVVYTGTVCAFNPKSPKHLHVRRLLGERKMIQEQFFEELKKISKGDCNQQLKDLFAQERMRTMIEKS